MDYNNYYYGQPQYMGQQMTGFAGQPYVQQPMLQPQNVNAITEEEIKLIAASKPNKLDINISQEDNIRAMCTHKHNGQDVVQLINDESGDVWCPICQERWSPSRMTKEDITNAVNVIISQMQNAKWAGDLNVALVRDYFPMIPLLKKFPEIYEYSMQTFNKYASQNGYNFANEAAIYSQYNQLMNYAPMTYSNGYTQQQPMSYVPQNGMPVYGQPQQPYMNQPMGYGQAATAVNPMQAPYGVAPQAPNQQFVNQADMMMNGTVYGQPQAQAQNQAYVPASAQAPAEESKQETVQL